MLPKSTTTYVFMQKYENTCIHTFWSEKIYLIWSYDILAFLLLLFIGDNKTAFHVVFLLQKRSSLVYSIGDGWSKKFVHMIIRDSPLTFFFYDKVKFASL